MRCEFNADGVLVICSTSYTEDLALKDWKSSGCMTTVKTSQKMVNDISADNIIYTNNDRNNLASDSGKISLELKELQSQPSEGNYIVAWEFEGNLFSETKLVDENGYHLTYNPESDEYTDTGLIKYPESARYFTWIKPA